MTHLALHDWSFQLCWTLIAISFAHAQVLSGMMPGSSNSVHYGSGFYSGWCDGRMIGRRYMKMIWMVPLE